MGFVGTRRLGDDPRAAARPADRSETARRRRRGPGRPRRALGFDVRVELERDGGEPLTAQLTRDEAAELELRGGDIVWVRRPGVGETSAETLAA